jgi:oligoendopeptidase F
MNLAPFSPRRFLAAQIDLTETTALAPVFDQLEARLGAASNADALEAWLDDYSEVNAALSENSARTYIAMTCQTDDPAREKAYLQLVETVDPWLKPRQFALLQKLVAHPAFESLPPYYNVFRRSVRNRVSLYREANVARETEEARLCQQYQKIIGAMMVEFDGKEQTLAQLGRVLQETDRARRQQAWELTVQRRLEDREKLEDIFDALLKLRGQIAHEAGFADYRAYAFALNERFDYTSEDCRQFQDTIAESVVPLARERQRDRREKLGVTPLRPWDLAVDPENRPPLKPFATADEFVAKAQTIFNRLDPRLGESFSLLGANGLLDLESRKGKAPGGYQSTLDESRLPFIFMNAVGVQADVTTLLHEAGHAFHALAAREQRLGGYRGSPIEFCEVASMSMELMAAPLLEEYYATDEANRARRHHLEGIIAFFPWMATVDAFQHWLYTHPEHTRDERRVEWLALMDRFGGIEDYAGHESARAFAWHRQLHIFLHPFYYVEYGIAQLGALQMWRHARKNAGHAVDLYLNGLSLGGSQPLPELFAAAGLKFDFGADTIRPLVEGVRTELESL